MLRSFLRSFKHKKITLITLVAVVSLAGAGSLYYYYALFRVDDPVNDAGYMDYSLTRARNIAPQDIRKRMNGKDTFRYERTNSGSHLSINTSRSIDWDWHFKKRRSDNFRLHSLHMLNPLLEDYDSNRNAESLQESMLVAIDWIEHNPPELHNNQDKNFAWYDMAVGVRLYRLAYILDQTIQNESIDDKTVQLMYQSILDHLEYLQNDDNIIFHNNHGIYEVAGQKAAARRLLQVDPVFKKISDQADSRLKRMFNQQFTSEGVHKEHSPDYQRMVYATLLSLKEEGLMDIDQSTLDKVGDSLYWMIKPNRKIVRFGDSGNKEVLFSRSLISSIQSSSLLYYLTNGGKGSMPDKSYSGYKDSGFFAVKQGDSYLAQQAAFFSRTHKHADDLTFSWFDKGQDILVDAGKYGYAGETTDSDSDDGKKGFYYTDKNRQYIETTRAHNTVEIDDKDFLRKEVEPFGSALVDYGKDGDIFYVLSRAKELGAVNYQRLLVFKPSKWLMVIDNLSDERGQSRNYKQWFHFSPDIKSRYSNQKFTATIGADRLSVVSLSDNMPIPTTRGQGNPPLQGWNSPDAYKLVPSDAVGFKDSGSHSQFITLFTFDDPGGATNSGRLDSNGRGNIEVSFMEDGKKRRVSLMIGDDKVKVARD